MSLNIPFMAMLFLPGHRSSVHHRRSKIGCFRPSTRCWMLPTATQYVGLLPFHGATLGVRLVTKNVCLRNGCVCWPLDRPARIDTSARKLASRILTLYFWSRTSVWSNCLERIGGTRRDRMCLLTRSDLVLISLFIQPLPFVIASGAERMRNHHHNRFCI